MKHPHSLVLLSTFLLSLYCSNPVAAQDNGRVVRMAKIVVDAASLKNYKAALSLEIKTSVKTEAGVLALNAVYDKEEPTHITILEVYASDDAYKAHLQTPHFKKYKAATASMVQSLQLVDVAPIALAAKPTNEPQDVATP